MKWNEVKVETESEAVEAVANILMEAGASGVAIEDSLDVEHFQSDQYGEILDKNDFTIATTTFSDVPILKNYITKYSGKLFTGLSGGTGDIDIDFVFDPEWAGENEYEF